jgi:hypothetical protein
MGKLEDFSCSPVLVPFKTHVCGDISLQYTTLRGQSAHFTAVEDANCKIRPHCFILYRP